MPPEVRLRERGPRFLSDSELVGILLGQHHGEGSEPMPAVLLNSVGGIHGLLGCDLEIARAQRISEKQATLLLAAIELGRRLHSPPEGPLLLGDPAQLTAYLAAEFRSFDQQVVGAFFGAADKSSRGFVECHRGADDQIRLDPRQILREAIKRRARNVMVFWFRPTLPPKLAEADFAVCKELRDACESMGLELLDVVFFSLDHWQSLRWQRPW